MGRLASSSSSWKLRLTATIIVNVLGSVARIINEIFIQLLQASPNVFSYICAAVDNISTDSASRGPSLITDLVVFV